MICKDDLVIWFKNLESYKRIDVMCTLLNLCLPFELRFLGTCLEELGRRDAQDLRGVELRVNNQQEFVSECGSFQTGQPTDMKIRRKMALYLALMRACNRTGVNELFKTLDRWGDRDFSQFSDGDPLQELLLVYTMATNHPVFSFEQRLKCGDIYSKILNSTSNRTHQQQQQSSTTTSPITSPLTSSSSFSNVQQGTTAQHTASPPPNTPQQFQQTGNTFQAPPPSTAAAAQLMSTQINPATAPQLQPNQILLPMAFQPTLLSSDPTTSTLALSVESLPSHIVQQSMVPIPPDFTTPPPMWQSVRYQPIYPTMVPIETAPQFPPQSSSPPQQQQQQQQSHHRDLSQPSSPNHSRTGSPTRQIPSNQPSHRNSRMRNTRPSTETTPPPSNTQQQQTQGSGTINSYMGNNEIMVQTLSKNFDDLNMDGAISQLHSIRNGYNRPSNTIPRQQQQHGQKANWTTMQWQLQQQQQQQHQAPPHYVMQKTGSESGSSTGDMSPPPSSIDSTGIHGNNQSQSQSGQRPQAVNLSRLNGPQLHASNSTNSLEFNGSPATAGGATLVTSNSSGNLLLVGGPLHNFPTYRNIPAAIQRQQFPAAVNGEINIYPTPFPSAASFISPAAQRVSPSPAQQQQVLPPTVYPTNKLIQSCFNCGSINHTGLNCNEASMEDVTRNAIYKLDYTVSTQSNTPFTPVTAMTSSSSSGNLNAANNNNNINVNSNSSDMQLEPSIFIDLTQDTSSDSSISNR